jgi:poly-gamma-glutamate synthesis protein (capsule biosynthesis protein)
MKKLNFAATGDSFITRRLPSSDTSAAEIAALIGRCDVRFTNFEMVTPNGEGFPAAQSGGTWAMADPKVISDLHQYGFNLIAWANNHTMDYSYGGVQATKRFLDEYGFVHAGVGNNLAEASEVKYVESEGGRVALIAATSTFHESWLAGDQRPDMRGRPGVNPLRYVATYRVNAEKMAMLRDIAKVTNINATRELSIKEGFAAAAPVGSFVLGGLRFEESEEEGEHTRPHEGDLQRILQRVREAKSQADVVLISVHSHEMRAGNKDQPAEFLQTFAHRCIDEGAHAVIGHGPHILRGIEIYQGCPIFYSLGNFIFQNETVTHLPTDFYEKYGLGHTHSVAEGYDTRSANGTIGLAMNEDVWRSVIATWTMENGRMESITLHPIDMGFGRPRYEMGLPKLTDDTAILMQMQELSRPFGTKITIVGSVGRIEL